MPTCPYDPSLVLKPMVLVYISTLLVIISFVSLLSKMPAVEDDDDDNGRQLESRLCVLYKDGSTFMGQRWTGSPCRPIIVEGIPLSPYGNEPRSGYVHITSDIPPQKWWHPVKIILSHVSIVSTIVTIIPSWVVVVDFLKSGYRVGISQCSINVLLLMCSINWIWSVRDCRVYWRERSYRKNGNISWARFEDAREFIEEDTRYTLIKDSTEVTSDMNVVRIVGLHHRTGTTFAKVVSIVLYLFCLAVVCKQVPLIRSDSLLGSGRISIVDYFGCILFLVCFGVCLLLGVLKSYGERKLQVAEILAKGNILFLIALLGMVFWQTGRYTKNMDNVVSYIDGCSWIDILKMWFQLEINDLQTAAYKLSSWL